MASPEIPEVSLGARPNSRCQEYLGSLINELMAFGVPEGMHKVGRYVGMDEIEPPAILPGLGEGHTQLPADDMANLEIARSLVMQMLQSGQAGTAKLTVLDAGMTHAFADFSNLGTNLFEQLSVNGFSKHLQDLGKKITDRRNAGVEAGTLVDPREILVVTGADNLRPEQMKELQRLMAIGPDWGSTIVLGGELEANEWLMQAWPGNLPVQPDPPLPSPNVVNDCRDIEEARGRGVKSPDLTDILPEEMWTKSSKHGLELKFGLGADGSVVSVVMGNDKGEPCPHAIITGSSGSGKTNTIKAMLAALTADYGPSEVRIATLDFKEGTEFVDVAPTELDETYLPHAMLVGSNVNNDPEFGVAALRYLIEQITIRGDHAKKVGAKDYPSLREKDPEGDWPRLVFLFDEFQKMLSGDDKGNKAAAVQIIDMLDDIGRRGRSFGIHLILASQNLDNIDTLLGKKGLFNNFPLRIAGKNGTLLASDILNDAPSKLPVHHIVVNDESGLTRANKIVAVPNANPEFTKPHQNRAYENRPEGSVPPRVFDGDQIPALESSRVLKDLEKKQRKSSISPAHIVIADEVSLEGGSATFKLSSQEGQNFAVVGKRTEEAHRYMHTAAVSLGAQNKPGPEFALVCLDIKSAEAINATAETLQAQGHQVKVIPPDEAPAYFAQTKQSVHAPSAPGFGSGAGTGADTKSRYVFVYGGGSSTTEEIMQTKKTEVVPITEGVTSKISGTGYGGKEVRVGDVIAQRTTTIKDEETGRDKKIVEDITAPVEGKAEFFGGNIVISIPGTGKEDLADIMNYGPGKGTYTIVYAESGANLKRVTEPKNIGGYVAAGTTPQELSSFTPHETLSSGIDNSRKNRGAFYDKTSGKKPRTVMPYGVPELDET